MGHSRDKHLPPSEHMARQAREAEALQRDRAQKPDTELELMREFGVDVESIDSYMRGDAGVRRG